MWSRPKTSYYKEIRDLAVGPAALTEIKID
jgi:hypothetical protein